MIKQDIEQLQAESSFLTRQLQRIPETAVFARESLQYRLQSVNEQIRTVANKPTTLKARLTFNGKPVVGRQGIASDFASKAMTAFTDSIVAIAAASETVLSSFGPLPFREQNQLIITGVTTGSFGFVLQERPAGDGQQQLALELPSPVSQAVDKFQEVLQSTQGSDDELGESVADLDRRALDKVRAFLLTLSEGEAYCRLEHDTKILSFNNLEAVRNSLQRLAVDNIREERQEVTGYLVGVLPNSRTFEFVRTDTHETIKGKILPGVQHVEQLNDFRNRPFAAQMQVTTAGNGRPRFALASAPPFDELTQP